MAITGTQSSGTMTGLNDMLKEVYTEPFENNIEKETEILDLIEQADGFEVREGPDGKQIHLGHRFSSGGGVGAMLEDDYLPGSTPPTFKQSTITIKQLTALVELSGRAMRRAKAGPAGFLSWADEVLPARAARLAYHKDRMALGLGSGVIGRYTSSTPSGTNDTIGHAFGIPNLEGALNLLLRDDTIRAASGVSGTGLRVGTMQVGSIDQQNGYLNTLVAGSPAAAASAAQNDYLFLGSDNVVSYGNRETMGLEGIIDDGTLLATFQGLSRTTYPELRGQVIDSTANGYSGVLNEDLLDYADSACFERGDRGKPSVILANRSGQRSFWKSLRSDRQITDPRATVQGNYTGGKRANLTMILGDREVIIRPARKVPLSRCYGIDTSSMKRYRIGAGRWDDTDGAIWNRVVDGTGRKDAFFAVYVEEEEMGASNPEKNFKLTNLAAA